MFSRPRIIPCLTMIERELVKTIKFKNPRYLGDPVNAVKIFNGKYVDELCLLDIRATSNKTGPDFDYLKDIASEAFMPLSYGGGITKMMEVEKLFNIGFEKVIFNSSFYTNPGLIKEAVKFAGSQSIVISIDVKTELFKKQYCYSNNGKLKNKYYPDEMAKKAEALGAGEIIINSIDNDGGMNGYDLELIKKVTSEVSIPVVACGGAKDIYDLKKVLEDAGAHAAAAGSMFVYYGPQKAVLITVPDEEEFISLGIYKS